MADHAHDMGLTALRIKGVAHGFTVDGQSGVLLAIGLVPALQRTVEIVGIDTNQNISDDRLAGDQVASVNAPAAKALAGFGAEALRPVGHRLVAAHATESGGTSNGQHACQRMTPSLGTAGIGNVGKEVWQRSHLLGA